VDDQRAGAALRALRRRRRLRQLDIAVRAGVAQSTVSRAERGYLDRLSLHTLRSMFAAVEARVDVDLRWRGGALDRLLDARHAALCGDVSGILVSSGWSVVPEATFSVYGERGSVDILAGMKPRRAALAVEVKTELLSIEETLRRLDVKSRLAPDLCRERLGWRPTIVGRVVVLPESRRSRLAVGRNASILDVALPDRGRAVRDWLRTPIRPMSGLWPLSAMHPRTPERESIPGSRVRRSSTA
jgi:transcriptional regulator with XRE-family HTH domain